MERARERASQTLTPSQTPSHSHTDTPASLDRRSTIDLEEYRKPRCAHSAHDRHESKWSIVRPTRKCSATQQESSAAESTFSTTTTHRQSLRAVSSLVACFLQHITSTHSGRQLQSASSLALVRSQDLKSHSSNTSSSGDQLRHERLVLSLVRNRAALSVHDQFSASSDRSWQDQTQ